MFKINKDISPNQFLLIVLMTAIILLSPFYFYASGLPQPSHVLIFFSAVFVLFFNRIQVINFFKYHKSGLFFIILMLLINSVYAIFYENFSFVINSVYWLFNFSLFSAVLVVIRDKPILSWVPFLIMFKFAMIVFSYLIGWGDYEFWPRYDYFFNGPNQLAYFSLCLLLVYVVITKFTFNLNFWVVYSMAVFVVLSSGGRSAYLALIPLLMVLSWVVRKRLSALILVYLLPFVVNFSFIYFELPDSSMRASDSLVNNVSKDTVQRILNLTLNDESLDEVNYRDSIVLQLSARGYLRAVEHPLYLLFGAGQGYEERFVDRYGYIYEIHSSIFAVFFYYGFLGLILFVYFIWDIFDSKINILWLSPLFVYGLFTYGLRSPYFWLALAFLSAAPNLFELAKSSISNHRN